MNERPLNERPAARPLKVESQVGSAPSPPLKTSPVKESLVEKLGCFWTAFLGASAILLVLMVLGATTGASKSESGSETYDVQPSNSDSRANFPISKKCETGMAASASDQSAKGEILLKATGNLCSSREEWEAALYKYPMAIGVTSPAALNDNDYVLLCSWYPDVKICKGFKK